MRKIKKTDLVGKTIKSIDNSSVNVLRITFDDESELELRAETAINTIAGSIPGIYAEDVVK